MTNSLKPPLPAQGRNEHLMVVIELLWFHFTFSSKLSFTRLGIIMNDKKFDTHEEKSESKTRLMSYNNTQPVYFL